LLHFTKSHSPLLFFIFRFILKSKLIEQLVYFVFVVLLAVKAMFVAIIIEVKVHLDVFYSFIFSWVNFNSKDQL
jgi:hypothetical protein